MGGSAIHMHGGLPLHHFETEAQFERWIRSNFKETDGIWLAFAKKGTGVPSITYVEAREVAIRWGWIDGLKNKLDETHYVLRFTPRRKRSRWSQINREIAEGLIAEGRMEPSGLAEVEAARKDGRWAAAYPPASKIDLHPELRRALAEAPRAKQAFEGLSAANRYAILYSVHDARRDETRTRRIAKYVAMLEAGDVPHPDR